jgi:hypothetical protein
LPCDDGFPVAALAAATAETLFAAAAAKRSGGLQIHCLAALGVRLNVKGHALPLVQRPKPGLFDRCGMHEYVLAAAFRRIKPKPLVVLKNFTVPTATELS